MTGGVGVEGFAIGRVFNINDLVLVQGLCFGWIWVVDEWRGRAASMWNQCQC